MWCECSIVVCDRSGFLLVMFEIVIYIYPLLTLRVDFVP